MQAGVLKTWELLQQAKIVWVWVAIVFIWASKRVKNSGKWVATSKGKLKKKKVL